MRHVRKQQKSLMPKILLIVVLVAALSISSVVTVMANTADITVYDGSETYRFSMIGQNPQDILSRAQTEGMAPVSDIVPTTSPLRTARSPCSALCAFPSRRITPPR